MNAPMRASVVKSPEHFEFARETSTDPAGAGPPPKSGARGGGAGARPKRTHHQPESNARDRHHPELAAAVECDPTQATTNSYTCQPEAADHQMTYALRSVCRGPEASEPHLANGFLGKPALSYGSLAPARVVTAA
jgi:hypothetical protein